MPRGSARSAIRSGAKETLYLAAFDERVKATVSSEGGIGTKFSNWDAAWYLGPAIKEPAFTHEHHELLALAAPRPFLLVGGNSADGDRGWPFIAAPCRVYELYGKPARLRPIQPRQRPRRSARSRSADRRVAADLFVAAAAERRCLPPSVAHPPHEKNHVLRNPQNQTGGDVYDWMFRMWARDIVIAIRRELDNDTNTVCLGRLLDEMAQRPKVITRARYLHGIEESDFRYGMLWTTFDGFGVVRQSDAAPLADYLDPAGIAADRRRLLHVGKPVLAYANQLVAHRSETEHIPITLGDVNRTVEAIEEVFVKYYAIVVGPSLVASSLPSSVTG